MATMTAAVGTLLVRDLRTLRREIESYPDDASVWLMPPGVPNSAGTLVLHLAGNIQHFIGATLGATGYVRDRPSEFSKRDVSRTELLGEIERAIEAVEHTFGLLDNSVLEREYGAAMGKWKTETGDALVHIVAHFCYHLGQIDYHRRIVTGSDTGVNAVAPGEMLTAREPA
jgi:uncharacterized damage-inducible protein DinB